MSKSFNVAQRTLYDIRDNKSYTVRKMADGNCWMGKALLLAISSGQTYEGWGSYNDGSTFDLTSANGATASCSHHGTCAMNGNTVLNAAYDGYYYSWYAATGGTGLGTGAEEEAAGSICPKNWRLPPNYTYNKDRSYGNLTDIFGYTTNGQQVSSSVYYRYLEQFPFEYRRTGMERNGIEYGGVGGSYWPSTSKDSTYAWEFDYNTSGIFPQNYREKVYGFPIRCIARW